MVNEVFDLQFDANAFVANIEKSIKALSELEAQTLGTKASVERLAKGATQVNFMTPANSVMKLNSALQQTNVSTLKLDSSQLKLATAVKATDTANRAYAKSTETARKETEKLNKETANTAKGLEGMLGKIKGFGGNILGALGITAGIAGLVSLTRSIIGVTAEFEKYKAVLTNTLGSAQLAENAISTITEFASKTPFSVAQLTDSFVKLANQGFVPTIAELRKLGDLASSTGKDFDQLAEAILDAQTGEFERLKEFGIKGKVNGDKVLLTFKGIRTEIDNNAEAIRRYVLALGDVQGVTGSMEAISQTLTGQISNLGDAWDQLLNSIGKNTRGVFSTTIGYVTDLLTRITDANDAINELNKYGDENAGSFMRFVKGNNSRDEASGKTIVDAKKTARELAETRSKDAKSVADYEALKVELYKKGTEAVEAERKRREKDGVDVTSIQSKAVLKGIADAYSTQYKAVSALEKKFVEDAKQAKTPKALTDAQKKALDEMQKLNESYEKALIGIMDRVAKKRFEAGNPDAEAIKAEAERSYKLEADEVQKTFGKLGKVKVQAMQAQVKALSDLTLAEDLKTFKERQEKAREEITQLLKDDADETTAMRIANIKDQYQKENVAIEFELDKQKREILKKQADREKAINEQVKEKVLTAKEGEDAIAELASFTNTKIENAEQASYQKRLDNARKFFEQMLTEAKEASDAQSSELQKNITNQILKESERYAKGEISYAQYESRVEAIKRDEAQKKLDLDIQAGEKRLRILKDEFTKEADVQKSIVLKGQIDATEAGIAQAKVDKNTISKRLEGFDSLIGNIFGYEKNDPNASADIEAFKNAVSGMATQVVGLLQQQAQAEVASVDRSIALQQKRVDEAKRLADAGNAEYLQQEEDKMRELEAKKEEATRKQLILDSALQASQLLVAITGAIGAISVPGAGPALVAANIATILGALATGYGLVSNLSGKQPKFFTGTDMVREDVTGGSDSLSRGRYKVGRDTIPAWLHEGEAVIQSDRNKEYNPTVRAIRRGLLPPAVLNGFVRDYSNGINYGALDSALRVSEGTKFNESHFIEMNRRLGRLENVMSGTAEAIAGLNVNVAMDSNGFSASITKHLERRNKILNA